MKNQLENLYKARHDSLVKTMSRQCGDWHLAEDIVQEAFTRAFTFLPSFDPNKGDLGKWFNGILRNTFRDLSKESREGGVVKDLPDHILENVEDGGEDSERSLTRVELIQLISDYSNESHKEVLEKHFILGYSSREIAQFIEGMSQTNVTTIVKRFRDNVLVNRKVEE